MTLAQSVKRLTPQEYYRLEQEAGFKSDYYDGEIFAMAGGTIAHSLICSNIVREVGNRLKGTPCAIYESNLRLKVEATGLRTYPDAGVYCGALARDLEDPGSQTVTNPTVLFEVLSSSTEAYDRGFKSQNYRKIESLRVYVLVSQHAPHIEVYERQADGTWLFWEVNGLESTIPVPGITIQLPLSEIYDRVEFLPAPSTAASERPTALP